MSTQQNIILIIIDALCPNHLGCYGYNKPTSPCIDRIAKDSIKYTNAFATSNCTMPSLASINTGLHPLQHGVIHIGLPHQNPEFLSLAKMQLETLPASLEKNGYRTGAIDWLGGYLRNGYDYYSGILQDTKVYDKALNTTNAAINFIKKNPKDPFFLFLHYWDTHDPYETADIDPEQFKIELSGVTVSEVRPKLLRLKDIDTSLIAADYDASIRSVDQHIGRLFEYLDNSKLLDNTTVIITADHGESLGEHDIWFTHYGLYDSTLHIPLLIHTPSRRNYLDHKLALHQDFFPTILNLTGITQEGRYFYGHNLIAEGFAQSNSTAPDPGRNLPIRKHPLIAIEAAGHDCEAIRTQYWKLIDIPRKREGEHWYKDKSPSTIPKLYALKDDPQEIDNKTTHFPRVTHTLQNKLNQEISKIKDNFLILQNIPSAVRYDA